MFVVGLGPCSANNKLASLGKATHMVENLMEAHLHCKAAQEAQGAPSSSGNQMQL